MPRPVRPWFRFYTETVGDRKIRRLKPAQRWVWVSILSAARESPEPGRLLVAEGLPMSVRELADYAGVTEREAKATLVAAEALKMVHQEGEVWVATNFGRRQFESDNVTERTRKSRSKDGSGNVPTSDVGTFQRGSHREVRNAPETETEADTDSSTSVSHLTLVPPGLGLTGEEISKIELRLRCDRAHAIRVASMILSKATGEVSNRFRYVQHAIDERPASYAPTPSAGKASDHCPKHPGKPKNACGGCVADKRAVD